MWGGYWQGLAVSVDTRAICCAVCRADVWRMAAHNTLEFTLQLNEAKSYHGNHALLSLPDARLSGSNVCMLF